MSSAPVLGPATTEILDTGTLLRDLCAMAGGALGGEKGSREKAVLHILVQWLQVGLGVIQVLV